MAAKQKQLQGWTSVFRSSTDYEADMVRDRLDSAGIPAAVFTQRDHAFNLTTGALARVYVMVPADRIDDAKRVLAERLSDAELDEAAAASDPAGTVEGTPEADDLLDSGIETINLDLPESPPDEERRA